MRSTRQLRGQTLVEFALVVPMLVLVLAGIIIFGLAVFYQQQLANAAREAARWASIHSATSQCPTTSWLEPQPNVLGSTFDSGAYYDCDPPDLRWPVMTAHARSKVFGLERSDVHFAACWSGYWDETKNPPWDAPVISDDGLPNDFADCKIGGIDPRTDTGNLLCPPPMTLEGDPPGTGDDRASNLAASNEPTANQVTVYACYKWSPPFLGSFVGGTITIRAVITEAMQHQR